MAKSRRIYSNDPRTRMDQAVQNNMDATNDFIDEEAMLYEEGDDISYRKLEDSALADVAYNKQYEQYELDAMDDLAKRSKSGLSMQERANLAQIEDDTNASNRGRQEALASEFAARGQAGSGMEAVARMQASQDSTNRQARESREVAARDESSKLNATQALGQLAGQKGSADYNRNADKASATDRINEYNNRGANSAVEQNWNRTNTTADRNRDAGYERQKDVYGAQTTAAQTAYNWGSDQNNANIQENEYRRQQKAQKKAAMGSVIGGVAGSYFGPAGAAAGSQIGGSLMSDENVKTDIRPEKKDKLDEFLEALNPSEFRYRGEDKERHGIIAQDVEDSRIGRSLIEERPEGKSLNVEQTVGALLAAIAHLNDKVNAKG